SHQFLECSSIAAARDGRVGAIDAFTDREFARTLVAKMGRIPRYYQVLLQVKYKGGVPTRVGQASWPACGAGDFARSRLSRRLSALAPAKEPAENRPLDFGCFSYADVPLFDVAHALLRAVPALMPALVVVPPS